MGFAQAASPAPRKAALPGSGQLCPGARFELGDKSILSFDDLSRYFSFYSLIPKIDTSELVTLNYHGPACGSFRTNLTFYLRAGTRDLRRFRAVYQYNTYQFFSRLFKRERDTLRTVLDLGAHTGMSTMFLAAEAHNAQVVAVEPYLPDFALLRLNTAQFLNVHLEYGAAWTGTRGATVKVANGELAHHAAAAVQSAVSASDKSLWQHFVVDVMDLSSGKQGEIVPSISVQHIMEKYRWTTIDFLKVDVQGAERVVFGDSAAKETWLKKVRCFGVHMTSTSLTGSSMRLFIALERELKLQRPRFNTGDVQVWCRPDVLMDAPG